MILYIYSRLDDLCANARVSVPLPVHFGHIMYGLCSEGIGNSTRLAKCPRDFVEAPSQMLENWCWQKSILERLSTHYQTGEELPAIMLNDMIRAKHVNVAFGSLRQIYLSRVDWTWKFTVLIHRNLQRICNR